jgi:Fe-S-cluster-containing hydrogenase component 2
MTRDRTRPSGYKDRCKQCNAAKAKTYRQNNPNAYKQAQERYRVQGKQNSELGLSYTDKRAILNSLKSERGCYFCHETTAVCLDFHHRDMAEKEFTVSKHFHRPISVLLQEIEKCEVVCANCHRKLHAGIISF